MRFKITDYENSICEFEVKLFDKYLPMIDINIILKSIEPHFLRLEKDYIQFEIHSDECDGELITSMIIDINNELKVGISDY